MSGKPSLRAKRGTTMTRSNRVGSWLAKVRRIPRRWLIVGAPFLLIIFVAYAIAFLIDEPLRRYTEAKMNRALKGYTVRVGKLAFHPHGFSLDLKDTIIIQDAYPEPPVARIPLLSASVHWRALLSGKIVGYILIDRRSTSTASRPGRRSRIPRPSRTAAGRRRWKRSTRSRSTFFGSTRAT